MSAYVIWIDHEHAKIFKIDATGVTKSQLKNEHHPHSTGNADTRKHAEENKFYHAVAQKIAVEAEELLVMGPGNAKTHFKTHLESHHHTQLAKNLVGVETVEHGLSDNQILDASRKFFKKYNKFHAPV